MSDLTLSGSIRGGKAPTNLQYAINNLGIDLSGKKYTAGILDVTTTPEAIPMGEVTNPGICFFRNPGEDQAALDDVQVGKDVGGFEEFIDLAYEQFCISRLPASVTAPEVRAVATTGVIEYLIFER